jgi:hypothetical protein
MESVDGNVGMDVLIGESARSGIFMWLGIISTIIR